MRKIRRPVAATLLAAVSALAMAACGSSGTSEKSGTMTAYYTSTPDFMDPALGYSQGAVQLLWTVYTPLLTYRHAEGAAGSQLIPGLAEALPDISADGKTYKLRLRPGLKYSDGTPVRASDFERTIQRVLHLESGGSGLYMPIVGAEQYVKNGKATADIPGIVTDDQTGEITIRLTQKVGSFANVLAMEFAGLVPGDTPFRNLTSNPPAGVGPYEITRSVANRGVTLKRSPSFASFKIPGIPTGNMDQIDVTINKNQQQQIEDVLQNKVDFINDPPPAGLVREVNEKAKGRYAAYVTNSTYFLFLNNRVAPFNDERVRQAVNYALDKRALRRLFGGLLAPTCNYLPPQMQGYRKLQPCPYGDPTQAPDVARAKQLIQEAGATGAKVTVWGNDQDPSKPVTEYVASVMNDIGLRATPRIVEGSVYFQTIGSQATKAQAGFANWFQDYPHPATFMPPINGAGIQPTNNVNFGNVDDPEVNRMIADADASPDLDAVAGTYAQIDKDVVDRAYLAPYGNAELTKLVSDKIDWSSVIAHPVYYIDLTQIRFK